VSILSQKVRGRITNYRTGIKDQTSNECLIEFENVTSVGSACKLIGQKVTWTNGTTKLIGKVRGAHGKNGMVKVRFVRGVPGQAIGTIVHLMS
jgi:large subunit ribosomal protein L35Ae